MNAARLLEYFDQIAEAPDAISRLRKFILDLAVRGKLVEQDPNDEPASELLKRIHAESVKQSRLGKAKKAIFSNVVDSESLPFKIPNHWQSINLCEFGTISGGMTPSKLRNDFWDGGVNWFSPKDIKSDEIFCSELKITEEGLVQTGLQLYPPGCLFVVARSGILKRKLPVSINRVEGAANQDIKVLKPFLKGAERYVQIVLLGLTDFILTTLVKTGTTVQSLKYDDFESLSLPLPPLAEQHRIVAKVDELMALCDRLEASQAKRESRRDRLASASLKRIGQPEDVGNGEEFRENVRFHLHHLPRLATRPEHVKELRQTILNLAVRGKLVPQDPNDEPLCTGCLRTSSVDQPPFSIPGNWCWSNLPTLGHLVGGGTPSKNCDDFWKGGIPWIAPKDMKRDIIDKSNFNITEEAIRASAAKLVENGSILFVVRGMILTHSFPVAISGCCLAINQDMKALELMVKGSARYLLLCLKGLKHYFLDKVQLSSHGTCRLVAEDYCSVLIPMPPLAEQQRIVTKVDELMNLCDQLEVRLAANQTNQSRLLEATLCDALGITCLPVSRPSRPAPSLKQVAAMHNKQPPKPIAPHLGHVETPKAVVQGSLIEQATPQIEKPRAVNGDIPGAILAQMQPGQEYSRAQLAEALGLSVYEWNMAIRELKESGRVVQTGERRGARYRIKLNS